MQGILRYRGYQGSVQRSKDGRFYYGKVEDDRALLLYEGQTISELRINFKTVVDDYIKIFQNAQV